MKKILFMLAAGSFLCLSSCKNTATDNTAVTTETVTDSIPPAFTPFSTMLVIQHVKDYDKFRTMYLSKDSLRGAYGISKFALGKGQQDSSQVFVFDKYTDLQKVKDFTSSPALKDAMKDGGTVGVPKFAFLNVLRFMDVPAEYKDRVLVSHKVKDFDVWLKAFDAEGSAARASFGMIDRSLARGADADSNMVYIIFAVSDMAKAKARSASPELKKIMDDAGVIGPPVSYAFRITDIFK